MPVQFRADHVGSFLRPPELLVARENGVEPACLQALEDEHILRILSKQRELGIEIFTDGELRRRTFMSNLTESVTGFGLRGKVARNWDDSQAKPKVSDVLGIVDRPLRQVRPLTGHEFPFLRHSPGAIKVMLASPTQFPGIAFKGGNHPKVYKHHST